MRRYQLLLMLAAMCTAMRCSAADDTWQGSFTIIPVSAPQMALEVVGANATPGTMVSIGTPNGQPSQRWELEPLRDDLYAIHPVGNRALVMAVENGGKQDGTQIVLEQDSAKPWQHWHIKRFGGAVNLVPDHAPDKGLDDFGGGKTAGSRQDIWTYNAYDEHLQWILKPLAGAKYPKDMAMPATIHEFVYTESKIFPGTRRSVTVFVPSQYDGAKPACVYVRQDGYNNAEKPMLEQMISTGDMPVTVGVFVTSGELPAPMPNTMGRRNRCYEYDGMGDNYVRFLVDELLPYVANKYNLKLSTSGNDRCIAGGSSGGISAFNAAWERPDAFTRVYANSGSFVAFRGGHEFPTLVRKTEAKPIRAYLTTGMHDMENCAGDWYLIDQEMDKALKFSGYDYFFRAIDGPHVAGWNEYFMEAMRFIWKGWPQPVKAGSSAPRVRDVIVDGKGWEPVAQGIGGVSAPACNSKGEVLFIDSKANCIKRVGQDGAITVAVKDSAHASAITIGPRDELITVSTVTGRVARWDELGHAHTLVDGLPASHVAAMPNGALYVTGVDNRLWLVKDGKKSVVGSGFKHATGIAYRPDQWLLSVADGGSKWVYSYQIAPDNTLINKERFYWLHVADGDDDAGAGAMCYSRENQMFVGTRMGVQVCADDGPTQVILPMPDKSRVLGVCLGGSDHDTLYAFTPTGVWRRTVRVHGFGAFSPWLGAKGSPL